MEMLECLWLLEATGYIMTRGVFVLLADDAFSMDGIIIIAFEKTKGAGEM